MTIQGRTGGRFIQEDNLRVVDQGTGDGKLIFTNAPGKSPHGFIDPVYKVEEREDPVDTPGQIGIGNAVQPPKKKRFFFAVKRSYREGVSVGLPSVHGCKGHQPSHPCQRALQSPMSGQYTVRERPVLSYTDPSGPRSRTLLLPQR